MEGLFGSRGVWDMCLLSGCRGLCSFLSSAVCLCGCAGVGVCVCVCVCVCVRVRVRV